RVVVLAHRLELVGVARVVALLAVLGRVNEHHDAHLCLLSPAGRSGSLSRRTASAGFDTPREIFKSTPESSRTVAWLRVSSSRASSHWAARRREARESHASWITSASSAEPSCGTCSPGS